MDLGLRVDVRKLIGWGLRMPSSPPITSQSSVVGIKDYALIYACGGRIPFLNEITCMTGGPLSNDGVIMRTHSAQIRFRLQQAENGWHTLI